MDFRDMKNFYAIVEEGNISNAAKRLNIAQPPLSKQMKQLEDNQGVQLFELRGQSQDKAYGSRTFIARAGRANIRTS